MQVVDFESKMHVSPSVRRLKANIGTNRIRAKNIYIFNLLSLFNETIITKYPIFSSGFIKFEIAGGFRHNTVQSTIYKRIHVFSATSCKTKTIVIKL